DPARTQRFEHRRHLSIEHRDVAGDDGVRVVAVERGPGIESHAGVDRRAHLLERNVWTADRDFVHGAVLLAVVADDLRQGRAYESAGDRTTRRCRRRGGRVGPDQRERRLDLRRKVRGGPVTVNVHVVDAWGVEEEVVVQRG